MLRVSVMLWTGQSLPRQRAVITTTECSSNPMWSPVESHWKFDTWGYNNSSAQQEEERLLSFPGKDTGNEKPWTLKEPSELIPLYKSTLQPWHFGDLHFALHKCRPQTAILWWFWICSSLLEKNIWQSICSGQQREWNQQDWESTWKIPKGKLSTWHIWVDTSLRLIRCRTIKTKNVKNKLQEINLNLLGSLFCHNDIQVTLNIPLGCSTSSWGYSYCIKLAKLNKSNTCRQQGKARERALESSPSLLLQHVDLWLLMKNNKWYSKNGAKNTSLKVNICIHSQSVVTEDLTEPTSLNHLSTQPVHIPLMSSVSLTRVSEESVLTPVTGSTSTLPLQGDSSLTETWSVSGDWGCNHSLKGQVHLVQDPAPLSSLGKGPALTPNLLASGRREERNSAEDTPEAAVRTAGTLPGRVSADWTIHFQLDTVH